MSSNIFIICGYGVPKDILKDENYTFYLKTVFNTLYDIAEKTKPAKNYVIFSGGKTDCFKPYTRTEAGEMIRFFTAYLATKRYLKDFTRDLIVLSEKRALSTLENFIYTKAILDKRAIGGCLYIFCEKTRETRVKILAKKVFNNKHVSVFAVDFDTSPNRYLDPAFLAKKEKKMLAFDLWALENANNFKKYHALYKKRMAYFRRAEPKHHTEAVRTWWEEEIGKAIT
ncbi:MAG: hypothetical protein Q8P11_02345 [bacterium]|nr:hypothetical protein [bacterium]